MKLILLCLTLLVSISAQSKYLHEKEEYHLKKGGVFNLKYKETVYALSYDIWANQYVFVMTGEKKSFSKVDEVFEFLKTEKSLPYIYLIEVDKNKKDSDIFLVNVINDFFKILITRKINLNEIYK